MNQVLTVSPSLSVGKLGCGFASQPAILTGWQSPKPFVVTKRPARTPLSLNAERLAAIAAPVCPLSILVVEDNEINRMLTVKMFNHFGQEVDAVSNGRECLEALAVKSYHLFMMDLQMPIMDGFTATREIRLRHQENAATPPPYICALTAHVMAKSQAECLAAGMDDFLSKPLRLADLKVVVMRVAENLQAFHAKLA